VLAADVLVLAGPIWLGDNSSVTKRVIERLYGCSALLNDQGQYAYYGRVGGCWALPSRRRPTPAGSGRSVLAYGNQRTAWDDGTAPGHLPPEP
jgi:hypothetical protein